MTDPVFVIWSDVYKDYYNQWSSVWWHNSKGMADIQAYQLNKDRATEKEMAKEGFHIMIGDDRDPEWRVVCVNVDECPHLRD